MPMSTYDHWTHAVTRTMPTHRIVEHIDVVEDVVPGLGKWCTELSTNALALDELEEDFGNSIIVAIASSAHALLQIVDIQEIALVISAELTPLARVHHNGILRLCLPQSKLRATFAPCRSTRLARMVRSICWSLGHSHSLHVPSTNGLWRDHDCFSYSAEHD